MFVCVMMRLKLDVMLFFVERVGGVPRCWLQESFPGESILCEAPECLLESVSGAVIDQLLDFVFL